MAAAIFTILGLAYWDARRESEAALRDFAAEQATLARGVGVVVSARAAALGAEALTRPSSELLSDVRSLEAPGSLRLFLSRPGQTGLATSDDRRVLDDRVESALSSGVTTVELPRDEAPAFSLPRRMALVGASTFDGPGGRWTVAVAATALRERDRERRALLRLLTGVALASGLVLAFGGLALRKQRKELALESQLAVAEIQRERDAELVQIDKLATLGALATGIAHEVSTPLGVIVGRAEQLLPRLAGDEKARKNVESILEQGARISGVVRGFLHLARGHGPLFDHAEPAALSRAAAELVQHRFDKAGVRLEVKSEGALPSIAGDPRLLEQAVINLLLNACDACVPGGRVHLDVTADAERVAFVVTDDGAGIDEAAAARALEPFFTTKPVGQGTGLGLAIANEIVKNHGGDLTIAPRARANPTERGTRACIEIPVAWREPR